MDAHDQSGFLVQWHLTERCNLSCPSCAHCHGPSRGGSELTFDEILHGLDQIAAVCDGGPDHHGAAPAPNLTLAGGEPLLRPDLFRIMEEIGKRGHRTVVLTNGTLVDRSRARTLAELGLAGAQVRIEGCEEVHDALCGPGSFSRASDGIEHLLDAGIKVTVTLTLSRQNAKGMKKVMAFVSHLGVQRVGFSRALPADPGTDLAAEMLSREALRELYEELFSYDLGIEIVVDDPVANQMRADRNMKRKHARRRSKDMVAGGCSAGIAGLTFLADGTIVPCRRLPLPLGNLRTDPLRQLWASSPVLEALRDRSRYRGACGACDRWDGCRGCRAIAYAHARIRGDDDYCSDDPQCFFAQ